MEDQNYIKEGNIEGHIKSINLSGLLTIAEQMKKSVCKIYSRSLNGTGFFCKIQNSNEWDSLLYVLITNNHILNKQDLELGKKIKFSINDEEKTFEIKIDELRKTYTNKDYDVTIIEMKQTDGITPDSFLEIDKQVYEEDINHKLKKKPIYLLHYKDGLEIFKSEEIIRNIGKDNLTIEHFCDSSYGSSGGPLINFLNFKVIGIHKGASPNKNCNIGVLIRTPIEEFKNSFFMKLKDLNKIQLRKKSFMDQFYPYFLICLSKIEDLQKYLFEKFDDKVSSFSNINKKNILLRKLANFILNFNKNNNSSKVYDNINNFLNEFYNKDLIDNCKLDEFDKYDKFLIWGNLIELLLDELYKDDYEGNNKEKDFEEKKKSSKIFDLFYGEKIFQNKRIYFNNIFIKEELDGNQEHNLNERLIEYKFKRKEVVTFFPKIIIIIIFDEHNEYKMPSDFYFEIEERKYILKSFITTSRKIGLNSIVKDEYDFYKFYLDKEEIFKKEKIENMEEEINKGFIYFYESIQLDIE